MSGADPGTLSFEAIDHWVNDVERLLGRLLVVGCSYPSAELPASFALLAERAQLLGAEDAQAQLATLSEGLARLCPGPRERSLRASHSATAFAQAMELTAWMRLFRSRLDVQRPADTVVVAPEDGPSFTGEIVIEGAVLEGQRLILAGWDAEARPIRVLDLLASVPVDDATAHPVISRLFQNELSLQGLLGSTLRFEQHPLSRGRRTWVLKPAFRSAPTRRDTHIEDWRESVAVHVIWRDGVVTEPPLQLTPLVRFNLTKLLIRGPVTLQAWVLGGVLYRADAGDGPCLPTVDARCWRVLAPVSAVSAPTGDPFVGACDEAMRRSHKDPSGAIDFLEAHLDTLTEDDPPYRWRVGGETRFALGGPRAIPLPEALQRLRCARMLRASAAGEAAAGLGDMLAWADGAPWRDTILL